MSLTEVRLGIEPSLPPYHGGVQPQHLQTKLKPVTPDGIEPSLSWMSPRCLRRWTTGSKVTEVGVEPTQSQVLGLLALPVCVPGHVSVAGPGVAPGGRSL